MLSNFLIGISISTFVFTLVFLTYYWFDFLDVKGVSWHFMIINAFFNLIGIAIFEELISRSFFINGLKNYIKSEYLIIFITGIFFSLAHILNKGVTIISSISTFIGGVMYAYAFLKSKNIWLPIGLHFAWNFVQGCVFGFFVSGYHFSSILNIEILENNFLTGGAYGPEGSLIGIIARFIVIFILWKLLVKNKALTR